MDMFRSQEAVRSQTERGPHSYLRKVKKPLIEKKRRDRINKSLTNLKTILLENIKRNGGTQTSKLDKADILEMAVSQLRMIQLGQSTAAMTTKFQYNHGYQECANQAFQYLRNMTPLSNQDIQLRLRDHLSPSVNNSPDSAFMAARKNEEIKSPSNVKLEPIKIQIPNISYSNRKQHFSLGTRTNLLIPVSRGPHDLLFSSGSIISPVGRDDQVKSPSSDNSMDLSISAEMMHSSCNFSTSEHWSSYSRDSNLNETSSSFSSDTSTSSDVWRPW